MPVQVGDLVGFYRRKSPGMGIILERIDDILEYCEIDRDVAFQIAENAQGRHPPQVCGPDIPGANRWRALLPSRTP